MLKIRFPGFDVIYKYPKLLFLFLFPSYHRNKRITQLMAGGGVVVIGTTLIPLLSGLF